MSDLAAETSWGHLLQNYDKRRRASLPRTQVRKPLKTISAIDPIKGTYFNSNREEELRSQAAAESKEDIENGWNRLLAKQTQYNIVCNTDHRSGKPVRPIFKRPKGERARNFCILSNMKMKKTGELIPPTREEMQISREPSEKTKREKRDYDVIVNKYVKNHESKMKKESEIIKKQKSKQYLEQRSYDIILGKYRDLEKENRMTKLFKTKEAGHFVDALESRPMCQQLTEGACENILNGEKRSKHVPPVDIIDARHLRIYRVGQNVRKKYSNQNELDLKIHEKLSQTKSRATNFDSGTKKVSKLGYDIISNKLYAGKQGRVPPKPLCTGAISIWESFQNPRKVVKTNTMQLTRFSGLDVSLNPLER